MKKPMKAKTSIKTIVVKCLDWKQEVKVDADIFDDVYMEAATRVIESNRSKPNFSVSIVMECYEKKHNKDPNLHFVYNTYFVLINAAMYEKAEILRLNFIKLHGIDLKKQSLKEDEYGKNRSNSATSTTAASDPSNAGSSEGPTSTTTDNASGNPVRVSRKIQIPNSGSFSSTPGDPKNN
jgi:hypothetical protein